MDLYSVSFLAAGFNLSDAGTKKNGQIKLIDLMVEQNLCYLGFLTRAEMKQLRSYQLKKSEHADTIDSKKNSATLPISPIDYPAERHPCARDFHRR